MHPHSKRALVISWSDTGNRVIGDAIFDAIASGRIDHYMLRPSAPPDEFFHHAVSGLLLDWAETAAHLAVHVLVVGESWSGRAYELRERARALRAAAHVLLGRLGERAGARRPSRAGPELPLVVIPDGTISQDPTNAELARAAGIAGEPRAMEFDLVIVGAGPAGLSAAVYGASEGFSTLVVDEGGIGGQATSSSLIRNYLGFPRGVSGRRLAQSAYEQAWVFGAKFAFMQRVDRHAARRAAARSCRALRQRARAGARGPARDGCQLPPPGRPRARGAERRGRLLRRVDVRGAGHRRAATSTSSAAPTRPGRPRCTSPATRDTSRSWCGPTASAPACRDYLVQQVRGDARTSRCALRTEVVGGGGDGRLEHLVLRERRGRPRGDRRRRRALPHDRCATPHRVAATRRSQRDEQGFVLTGAGPRATATLAARALAVPARDEHARGVRGGRRAPRLGEAGGVGGRRGVGRDPAAAPVLRRHGPAATRPALSRTFSGRRPPGCDV